MRISVEAIKQARQYTDDVEFSPEDASRTELNSSKRSCRPPSTPAPRTINLPDTVGYAAPKAYGEIFSRLLEKIPALNKKGIILSAHCHDDLGLAVANSLAAVEAGARQVECTINGIGERAGNAALEEVVMALRTRQDYYQLATRIDTTRIWPLSRMVSTLTGLAVQRNKAVVGENAFAHEAGIHQDGILKYRETYEIMDPADVGIAKSFAGPGQTQRPPRLPRPRRSTWVMRPPTNKSKPPSISSKPWRTRKRKSSTKTSKPWWTTCWTCPPGPGNWKACR